MKLRQKGAAVADEPRYESGILEQVAALATRLQSARQETLTVREIEAIGAEVGLEPAFIREALTQLTTEQPRPSPEKRRKTGFWSLIAAWSLPLLIALLTLLFRVGGPL